MDFLSVFEISASGMDFQRARMEALAMNVANAQTTRSANGQGYKALEAVASTDLSFNTLIGNGPQLNGVGDIRMVEKNIEDKMVHKPDHPDADAQGYVYMPDINPVDEMLNMMTATRGFEANVKVFNAAKSMALKALEIGK